MKKRNGDKPSIYRCNYQQSVVDTIAVVPGAKPTITALTVAATMASSEAFTTVLTGTNFFRNSFAHITVNSEAANAGIWRYLSHPPIISTPPARTVKKPSGGCQVSKRTKKNRQNIYILCPVSASQMFNKVFDNHQKNTCLFLLYFSTPAKK
jgi:hypothetical protein